MMKAGKASFLWALVLAVAGFFPAGCGTPSEAARIREFLKESVALAEKKQIGALMERFSPDYSDFEGRDKADAERLIGDYLGRFRGIVIHLLSARVDVSGPEGRAAVECEMSFSHGAAEVLRKLISYTGEYYRFRFDLDKTGKGEWRFAYADWQSVSLTDLFPESLEILKKLFPDL
ncbi:MAG: hypothetical protein A2Y70_05970 [Candidatus Aminicenantes bacterium RBG_13_64_14]|nr:MAG: hypothetical protein A2Y70_05970 [Candidatus Aminicenantes bacterium RBG_13_64_14]